MRACTVCPPPPPTPPMLSQLPVRLLSRLSLLAFASVRPLPEIDNNNETSKRARSCKVEEFCMALYFYYNNRMNVSFRLGLVLRVDGQKSIYGLPVRAITDFSVCFIILDSCHLQLPSARHTNRERRIYFTNCSPEPL